MIEPENKHISKRRQCHLLGINRSLLYYKKQWEATENIELMKLIDRHHLEHPYKGVLQMQDYLVSEGYRVNIKRVRRLMRKMCIEVHYPKKNLSKLGIREYIQPYLLRDLKLERSNQVWAIDISYIPMTQGFMYLTAVIDWHSRYLLGFSLSNTLEAENQTKLIEELIKAYGKPEIINSDQGSQYTSQTWTGCLKAHNIRISMDGKGRATDNAIIERFFRTVKQECIDLTPTNNAPELRKQIEQYINYYNSERTHQGIGREIPVNLYHFKNKTSPKKLRLVV